MLTPLAKKFAGAILAAVTLSMVASVAPASAAPSSLESGNSVVQIQVRDSGWGSV